MSCLDPNLVHVVRNPNWFDYFVQKRKYKLAQTKDFVCKFMGKSSWFTHDYDVLCGDNTLSSEYINVPCGNCIQCKLDYTKKWAVRCMLESTLHQQNYFITLTYDDDHVPLNSIGNQTLVRGDLQKFIKRLRKHFKDVKIKYFGSGEYGNSSLRPHYHLILFNLPLNDLDSYIPYDDNGIIRYIQKKSFNGEPLYYSKTIKDLWPFGNHLIGSVSFSSCSYVARYCMKKLDNFDEFADMLEVEHEFVCMSTKPAIGLEWFLKNYEDVYKTDAIYLLDNDEARACKVPRYFDQKMISIDDSILSLVKEKRVINSKEKTYLDHCLNFASIDEMNKRKEKIFKEKMKSLKRCI